MKVVFILFFILASCHASAQRGERMDIGERMEREKQIIYDSINNLTSDQKLLIDQVYAEITTSMYTLLESGDMMRFREKLPETQENKRAAFRDILSDDQFTVYTRLMKNRRGQFGRRNPDGE